MLLFASQELPELDTPLESLANLLKMELEEKREAFSPVQQAILGSRDLHFGMFYRPEHAGWNDGVDVSRLAAWLGSLQAETWVSANLTNIRVEEQEEELAYVHEWLPALASMYRQAEADKCIIVCEEV